MPERFSFLSSDWGWHRYSEPGGGFSHDIAPSPDRSWWFPTIRTYGGPQLSPTTVITYDRYEADAAIRRALRNGYAVEVYDQTPTCLSRQVYAAGPCSPLTCAIGRPLRGAAPRYR